MLTTALLIATLFLTPSEPQAAGLKIELDAPPGIAVTITNGNGNQQLTTGKTYTTDPTTKAMDVKLIITWTDADGTDHKNEVTVTLRPGRTTNLTVTIREQKELLWI